MSHGETAEMAVGLFACRWPHLDQFGEGLVDENERNEKGEDLLSEPRDKANEDASLKGHSEEHNEHQPETDPDTTSQIVDPVVFTKLRQQ